MDVSARPDAGQWVNSTHDSSLIAAIIAAGLPAPSSGLRTDGSFTRWGINGSKPCWCVAHILNNGHLAASFGDWRTGSATTFRSWENGHPVDPNEAQRLIAELARRQKAAEAEDSATKAATAKRDAEIWQFLPESGDSEYLTRKQVAAHGIRYGSDHYGKFIAVPMRTAAGKFTAFQRIYDDGRKHFPKGAEKKGAYHLIGVLEPDGALYLAEGYATAASIHEATGAPVAGCFDAANLMAVANALKTIYPDLQLVITADSDQWKADKVGSNGKKIGNTGVAAAYAVARAHPGTRIAIPNFDNLEFEVIDDKGPTDFNDLATLTSLENVAQQLEKAFEPKPKRNGEDKAHSQKTPIENAKQSDQCQAAGRYSLQFAVAGQQPQSKVAAILTKHNSGLAYDHVAQKWLSYVDTQWKEITDTAAFRAVQQWIDAGLDDEGYTVSFVNGILAFLKALLATDSFDDNPRLVPFKNGVLDLSTMKLMDHSPELKISWCLPFNYDPSAKCEPVVAWLMECVAGDPLQVELLRAYIKAILTGRADIQRYLELIGAAGSGKGTFIRLCTKLVGARNTHVTELKRLENNRFEPARLYRKRLCIITDAEKYTGDVSILKAMTGEDDLPFEEKHKQGGESFKFRGLVLIGANQEIATSDLTGGLQRRRITVRFDNQVDPGRRRNLDHEFEPYLPGVIAWALSMDDARMKQLLVETDYYVPMVGGFNLATLRRVNPLAAWADDCLILDNGAETPVGSLTQRTRTKRVDDFATESETIIDHSGDWLYPNYVEWCRSKGNKPSSSVNFTGLLKDLLCNQLKLEGIEKLDRAGAKLSRFKGIRLRIDADQDIGNLLFGTIPVRVKYGLSTGYIDESTSCTEKSKFANSIQDIAYGNEERGAECGEINRILAKNTDDPVQSVQPVSIEQNQKVIKIDPVPSPYRKVTSSYWDGPDSLEEPPDPGPGYLDSLAEPFYLAAGASTLGPEPTASAAEPGPAAERINSPAHCSDCLRYHRLSRNCGALPTVAIEDPQKPPCMGRHFRPKSERQQHYQRTEEFMIQGPRDFSPDPFADSVPF